MSGDLVPVMILHGQIRRMTIQNGLIRHLSDSQNPCPIHFGTGDTDGLEPVSKPIRPKKNRSWYLYFFTWGAAEVYLDGKLVSTYGTFSTAFLWAVIFIPYTVEVVDNGPGIPETIMDQIMEPFFTTRKGTEGTGLGLSITHDIIKAHGGTMSVASKPDETTFSILLPEA